jgi:hypothetical protein
MTPLHFFENIFLPRISAIYSGIEDSTKMPGKKQDDAVLF